jgi:hypothetical protein
MAFKKEKTMDILAMAKLVPPRKVLSKAPNR